MMNFSGEKMYNACVWMRVLGGGLGACASGSILYNRLGEDKELNVPAIHKFTGMDL